MLERIQSQIDETQADSERKFKAHSFTNTHGGAGTSHTFFDDKRRRTLGESKCPNLRKLIERKRTDVNIADKSSVDSERVKNLARGELTGNVFKVGPMLRSLKQ